MEPTVAVVVLAYGSEPWLVRCVDAILASQRVRATVVLVDNGCTDDSVEQLKAREDERITVVQPGRNLGYAAGCNAGARETEAEFVGFVNYDAIVDAEALAALCDAATGEGVGVATASVRLAERPDRLNSAGNDIHYLGFSWSGAFDKDATCYAERRSVTGASGAGMVLRTDTWRVLGGFAEDYFMYHEDAELSLRVHLRGLDVVYVPEAVIVHRYEFSRNHRKFFLIERNRLMMVLTCFEARTLWLIAPALLIAEAATAALAAKEGWVGAKIAAWRWLVANSSRVRRRRQVVQASRQVSDHDLTPLFVDRIDPGNYPLSPLLRSFDAVLAAYWAVVRRFV